MTVTNGSSSGERAQSDGADHLDVRVQRVPGQLAVHATEDVASGLARLGRTEDLDCSPDGKRLVLAGYLVDGVAVADFSIRRDGEAPIVEISSVEVLHAPQLRRPHGVTHLDDDTLIVANRESELLLVDLRRHAGSDAIRTRVLVDGTSSVPVKTPGSVHVHRVTEDLFEITVCNNFANSVNRYLIDRAEEWRVVDAERLLEHRMNVPDGVAMSASGQWLAISNHVEHQVLLYRSTHLAGPDTEPDGVLEGINYPHGLTFAADDRCVLVADAGLPYVSAFESPSGDWSGSRQASVVTRVLTDRAFNDGRANPQEGGPKGLAMVSADVVAITCEEQPLAMFTLDSVVSPEFDSTPASGSAVLHARDRTATRVIARLAERLRDTERADAQRSAQAAERDAALEQALEVVADRDAALAMADARCAALTGSTSWKLTGPVRAALDLAKGIGGSSRH